MKAQLRLILEDFLAIEEATAPNAVLCKKSAKKPSSPEVGEVEEIHLPPHLFCVCLGEPELGLYAADIPCKSCGQVRNVSFYFSSPYRYFVCLFFTTRVSGLH
jgi:hypothetical protein